MKIQIAASTLLLASILGYLAYALSLRDPHPADRRKRVLFAVVALLVAIASVGMSFNAIERVNAMLFGPEQKVSQTAATI